MGHNRTLDDYWRLTGAKSGECFALACRAGAMLGTCDQRTIDTHAAEVADQTDRTVYLRDGQVVEERRSNMSQSG